MMMRLYDDLESRLQKELFGDAFPVLFLTAFIWVLPIFVVHYVVNLFRG